MAARERAAGAQQAVLTRSVAEFAAAHGGARWALAAQLAGQGAQCRCCGLSYALIVELQRYSSLLLYDCTQRKVALGSLRVRSKYSGVAKSAIT